MLQPTDPYEAWRIVTYEFSPPDGNLGGFETSRATPANAGLETPGGWWTETWEEMTAMFASFFAPLPAETTALGETVSFTLSVGTSPRISVDSGDRLRLQATFHHLADPTELGFRAGQREREWKLDAGGPGEVDGELLATRLAAALRAEKALSPTQVRYRSVPDDADRILFGLGLLDIDDYID